MYRLIYIVLLVTLPWLAIAEDKFDYRYWDLGASKKRDEYQYMLLRLILEKTVSEYGTFSLIKSGERYAATRSVRELERGEMINIIALPTPIWGAEDVKSKSSITVHKPLLRGLLGYRCVVIRKADLPKFNMIKTQNDLRALSAGQGKGWEDINVYRYNNFNIVDSADFYNLFAMLEAGRFDYIPLSIIEADEMMERFGGHAKNLVIVPDLLIYYPFPVLYNVSIKRPDLVKRLEVGLDLVDKDGSMDELFYRYFSASLSTLRSQPMRVAVLRTPNMAKQIGLEDPKLVMASTFKPILLP